MPSKTEVKPAVGRIVHVFVDPAINNGADIAPAIVTRVWSDRIVNLRVIRDNRVIDALDAAADWMTSVALFPSRKEAEKDHEQMCRSLDSPPERPYAAFWPERV